MGAENYDLTDYGALYNENEPFNFVVTMNAEANSVDFNNGQFDDIKYEYTVKATAKGEATAIFSAQMTLSKVCVAELNDNFQRNY